MNRIYFFYHHIKTYFRIFLLVLLAVASPSHGGYPSLEETVRCGVPTPEFKDSIEAAMRRRAPFGHVKYHFFFYLGM